MIHLHRQRVRLRVIATVTAALALPVLWTIAPLPAGAATPCTQTISGPHSGVLDVAADQRLCLKDAAQTGASVIGALTLNPGFSELELCGSKVVGATSATGGKGTVVVGGTGLLGWLSCLGNAIEGAVTSTPIRRALCWPAAPSLAQ